MATKSEEYFAVAALIFVISILWNLFGLFWSLLLVFTCLILAYQFGRPRTKVVVKKYKHSKAEDRTNCAGKEFIDESMDVLFTGMSSPKGYQPSLRSPLPFLAEVNKRLSFNVSSASPNSTRSKFRNFVPSLGSPKVSITSPSSAPQSPRYFSLINPTFQQQSTVKIAPPSLNQTSLNIPPQSTLNSACDRETVLSALRQSTTRKRSVVQQEDEEDGLASPELHHTKRRRYQYPVTNTADERKDTATEHVILREPPQPTRTSPIHRLIAARLKRRPLHSDKEESNDQENVSKKTKTNQIQLTNISEDKEMEGSIFMRSPNSENQIASTRFVEEARPSNNSRRKERAEDDSDSGCDANDEDDDVIMREVSKPATSQAMSRKRKNIESTPTKSFPTMTGKLTTNRLVSKKQRKQMAHVRDSPAVSEVCSTPGSVKSETSAASPEEQEVHTPSKQTPSKRFQVIRFASKNESSETRRRPVPVYCASGSSSDLPVKRESPHKVTSEDIESDRKLAWHRVQYLLNGSDDEEEAESEKKSVTQESSIAIKVTTCIQPPSSTTPSVTSSSETANSQGISTAAETQLTSSAALSTATIVSSLTTTGLSSAVTSSSESSVRGTLFAQAAGTTPSTSPATLQGNLAGQITTSASSTPFKKLFGAAPPASLSVSSSSISAPGNAQATLSAPAVPISSGSQTLNIVSQAPAVATTISASGTSENTGLALGFGLSRPSLGGTFATQATSSVTGLFSMPSAVQSKPEPSVGNPTGIVAAAPLPSSVGGFTLPSITPAGPAKGISQSGFTLGSKSAALPTSFTPTNPASSISNLAPTQPAGSAFSFGAPSTAASTVSQAPAHPSGAAFSFGAPATAASSLSQAPSQPSGAGFSFGAQTTTAGASAIQNTFPTGTPAVQSTFGTGAASAVGITKPSFGTSTTTSQISFSSGVSGTQNAFGVGATSAQNAFGLGATSKQNAFGSGTTSTQNAFGSGVTGTQNAFGSGATGTQNAFGSGATGTQNAFGSGATGTQNAFGSGATGTQNAFGSGATGTQNAFGSGATGTQNAFGSGATAASTFGFGASSQNAFGANATAPPAQPAATVSQNAFGSSVTSAASAFGSSSRFGGTSQGAMKGNQNQPKPPGGFSFAASQSSSTTQQANAGTFPFTASNTPAFGNALAANSTQKSGFGGGVTSQPAFGAKPSATPFGTPSTAKTAQNLFGAQPTGTGNTSNASAFGGAPVSNLFGSTAQSTASPAMASPFGAASAGSSMFGAGAAATTKAPATTGGFNFGNATNTATTGGFNFSSATNNASSGGFNFGNTAQASPATSGFNFGSPAPSGGFGQSTPAPAPSFGAAPATGGFNFTAGTGSPAPAFAPSTPTFGAGTNPGTASGSVARFKARASAARRRGRK